MIVRPIVAGIAGALAFATLVFLHKPGLAQHATSEEVEAAVKFYGSVKADPKKHQAYCDAKQGIEMMTSGPAKFAEAQQKLAAATKQLGPEFAKAQELLTRLDKSSEATSEYLSTRQALDKTCP
jgi:hypothetical protein